MKKGVMKKSTQIMKDSALLRLYLFLSSEGPSQLSKI